MNNFKVVGGVLVITLVGELDASTAPEIQQHLLRRFGAHHKIVIDASGITFMSSAGLRLLLGIYRHVKGNSGNLVLAGVSDDLRDTMQMTGFWSFLDVVGNVDDAVARLNEAEHHPPQSK
jgi:anti-sigma B factor antagonist